MNILIRKLVKVAGERQGHQDYEITTDRLSIGRGTDQDVLLTGERVGYQHAEIRFRGQAFEIRAFAATGITVNGQSSQVARLADGDQILIGGYRLVVIPPPEPHLDFALTVEELGEAPSEVLSEGQFITGPERLGWLGQRRWAWLGFIAILMLGLALPGLVAWQSEDRDQLRQTPLPDDHFWQSGPMSRAHQFIGHQCESCHKAPFERVPNKACEGCHEDMGRHVAGVETHRDITGDRCADCHREHNGQEGVVLEDQQFCTDCHADLDAVAPETRLADVSDFADEHPDLRVRLLQPREKNGTTEWYRTERVQVDETLRETSGLAFDHKVHLAAEGVENESGDKEEMACIDCHQPDAAGRGMEPIRMESHCSRCHSLAFDDDEPDRTVPHAEPEQVVQSLREYYSRRFIEDRPGRFDVDLDRPGAPAAVDVLQAEGTDWVRRRAETTAADLFERRVCDTCHEIDPAQGDAPAQWTMQPVRLNNDYWMHSARFSHEKHDHVECADCHDAAQSKTAQDVLMPGIDSCRQCHTGARDRQGLRSNCITCHRFHYREHGRLEMP